MTKKSSKLKWLSIVLITVFVIVTMLFVFNLGRFNDDYSDAEAMNLETIETKLSDVLERPKDKMVSELENLIDQYPMDVLILEEKQIVFSSIPHATPETFTGGASYKAVLLETQGYHNGNDTRYEVFLRVYHIPDLDFTNVFLFKQSILIGVYFLILLTLTLILARLVIKPLSTIRNSVEHIDDLDFDLVETGDDEITNRIHAFSERLKVSSENLSQRYTELEKELQIKKDRLNNTLVVSRSYIHDMKTPIHQLLHENEEFLEDDTKTSIDELAMLNVRRATVMLHEINSIMKILNQEAYDGDAMLESVDLTQMTVTMIRSFQKDFQTKQLEIDFEADDNVDVLANQVYLKLLMHNLFSNIVQYATIKSHVMISVAADENEAVLSFENESEFENIERMIKSEHIINAMSMQSSSSNRFSGGSGLFLIKDLAKMLDATYDLSFVDNRVKITITLPLVVIQ